MTDKNVSNTETAYDKSKERAEELFSQLAKLGAVYPDKLSEIRARYLIIHAFSDEQYNGFHRGLWS